MKPKVLILSGIYDFSSDLVAIRLHEFGVPFIRINREQLTEYRFSMDPVGPTLAVKGSGIDAEIGPDIVSVWFRQPVFLRNTPAEPLSSMQLGD